MPFPAEHHFPTPTPHSSLFNLASLCNTTVAKVPNYFHVAASSAHISDFTLFDLSATLNSRPLFHSWKAPLPDTILS